MIDMFCWRITKYNPQYRNIHDVYLKDEWTSYSDIGKIFDKKKFCVNEYLTIEEAYITAILLFMDCVHTDDLRITDLEKNNTNFKKIFSEISPHQVPIKNEQIINKEQLLIIIRLILREAMWCRLESAHMYVHFGYDYYMYIGASLACDSTLQQIKQLGLFVEEYQSPYIMK
ncbi:MAG: hypothetical protein WCE21_03885 [Candidatus Babeliales bacterium]